MASVIYIDETGSFERDQTHSSIGGWISDGISRNQIDELLRKSIAHFNDTQMNSGRAGTIHYPSQMHFAPLRYHAAREQSNQGIRISPRYADAGITQVFTDMQPRVRAVFRSVGMPMVVAARHPLRFSVMSTTVTLLVYTLRRAEELRNCANNPAQSRSTKAAAFVCRLFLWSR